LQTVWKPTTSEEETFSTFYATLLLADFNALSQCQTMSLLANPPLRNAESPVATYDDVAVSGSTDRILKANCVQKFLDRQTIPYIHSRRMQRQPRSNSHFCLAAVRTGRVLGTCTIPCITPQIFK
jgi:hypothetical protein